MRIRWVLAVAGLVVPAALASMPVQVEPAETNAAPPGSIVVPPPRGADKPASRPAAPALPATPQLVVSLADGSKLRGTTALKELTLKSEALGKLTVPLERIRQVKFSKDHESVTLTLHNGDRIQAGLGDTTLALMTLFGPVTVPLDKVTEIQVRTGGVGCAVEWDVLPFPRSDWGGPRGEPAAVNDEEVVLRGRPVKSKACYSLPVVVECEVTLEERRASDGSLDVGFLLPDESCRTVFRLIYRNPGAYSGKDGLFLDGLAEEKAVRVEAGKPYRLCIDVNADRIRVTLDDQVLEAETRLALEGGHLRLGGWQPTNTWRVRNVSVR